METGIIVVILVVVVAAVVLFRKNKSAAPTTPAPGDGSAPNDSTRIRSDYQEK